VKKILFLIIFHGAGGRAGRVRIGLKRQRPRQRLRCHRPRPRARRAHGDTTATPAPIGVFTSGSLPEAFHKQIQ